ncbi:transposase zinc-binding domain-containing protein [Desulfomarina profundi]|uniref:transposase zinc-binding domain-containing protein n=1 Tax=Desulfomarina profundi TaxID=2772557 RepID=UPI0038B3B152
MVNKYLECGDLHQGFARTKCLDCHHEFILAFSCRGRWFRSLPSVAYLPKLP